MQHREEHGKVACRTHPKLNVRHTFKRALYLAHAFDEAYQPQQRQEGDMWCKQVAKQYTRCGPAKQRLIGEAKLHAEQQREIDGHPCQVRVEAHQEVFPHQGCFPHHLVQRTQIKSSGELEGKGYEHIHPRPYPLRDKTPEHRHGERHGLCSSAHISISLYIPH